jgi:hypothetical protein
MHLLLAVSALELPGGFTLFEFSPSLCLSEPLSTVGRVGCCAFSTQKLHSVAICNVAHDVSFLRFLASLCAQQMKRKDSAVDVCGTWIVGLDNKSQRSVTMR